MFVFVYLKKLFLKIQKISLDRSRGEAGMKKGLGKAGQVTPRVREKCSLFKRI